MRRCGVGGRCARYERRRASQQTSYNTNALATVISAWTQTLGPRLSNPLDLDKPFYEMWGDLIVAAQLATSYSKAGFEIDTKMLIERPTMRGHAFILSGSGYR